MSTHLPPTILIIEPEVIFRTSISNSLERNGFIILAAATGDDALKLIDSLPEYKKPNLAIIGYKLPGLSGVEVCTILRSRNTSAPLPIILIADENDKLDEIKGLANTFDDYIVKPFAQSELVNKVKALLGKVKPVLSSKIMEYRDLKIDLASYRVTKGAREIHLGPTEFKILQCLVEAPKKIFSRESLMQYVWGKSTNVEVRTIDVHINRLRSALKSSSDEIPFIKTVRSMGYCLSLPGID